MKRASAFCGLFVPFGSAGLGWLVGCLLGWLSRVVEECCREMFEKSVVESVVQKCVGEQYVMLSKKRQGSVGSPPQKY